MTEKILLFGGSGLLGSELRRLFEREGIAYAAPAHSQADCRDALMIRAILRSVRPTHVILAAARVGGILANQRRGAEFMFYNALMNLVTLQACAEEGVDQAMLFGASCMYPKGIDRPIREDDLLTGPIEESNIGYAVGKLAAVKYAELLSREGRCRTTVCIPTNLYGDEDHFDPDEGHLIASLIPKMHRAKEEQAEEIRLWGDGTPRRDFLHAQDAARACLAVLRAQPSEIYVNIGSGYDRTVREIAEKTAQAVGFQGRLLFSGQIGNGTNRKLLETSRIRALGWHPEVSLEEGLQNAYRSYLKQQEQKLVTKES